MASPDWKYDAFLSFHGKNTRNSFTSHLYRALDDAKMKTFVDGKIPRGDNICSSIFRAIETSKNAVIVLSPDFPSSSWCVKEVVKIMECNQSKGQLVLTVFFHVDASDILTRIFEPISAKLGLDLQKVETWRSALREANDIYRWQINESVDEAEVIQQIVEVVSSNRSLNSSL